MQKNIINIIFTLVILIIAAIIFILMLQNREQGTNAVINIVGGNTIYLDLNENKIHEFTTQTGANLDFTIEVKDKRARFINSVCPDHVCENYGWQSHTFDEAICAPAGVVLSINE